MQSLPAPRGGLGLDDVEVEHRLLDAFEERGDGLSPSGDAESAEAAVVGYD